MVVRSTSDSLSPPLLRMSARLTSPDCAFCGRATFMPLRSAGDLNLPLSITSLRTTNAWKP
jgi:hypothetical protein